jgi:hypothetical protein
MPQRSRRLSFCSLTLAVLVSMSHIEETKVMRTLVDLGGAQFQGQKRASISATLVFAGLRQVTNGIEEPHQYSILADDIQRDRSVLLPSYKSTSLAHTMARSTLRMPTWKSTGRQPTADKCCALSGATREPALLISSKSNLPFFDLGHSRRVQNENPADSRTT